METHLLDSMLNTYKAQRTQVTLVLQNRSRISGRVRAFDSYVVLMQGERSEIVYRHSISSVLPTPAPASAAAHAPAKRPDEQARPAARPAASTAPAADRKKKDRPPSKPVAAAEPSLNTSMKEGLLRWMQEQKAK